MDPLDTVEQYCPYCGEKLDLLIDCSVPSQEYTEDCRVCCQPIIVTVNIDNDGDPAVSVRSENE